LGKDNEGLSLLRKLYGTAIAASPLGNAFQFIASANDDGQALNIETITVQTTASDVFEAFMPDCREWLLKSPESKA